MLIKYTSINAKIAAKYVLWVPPLGDRISASFDQILFRPVIEENRKRANLKGNWIEKLVVLSFVLFLNNFP